MYISLSIILIRFRLNDKQINTMLDNNDDQDMPLNTELVWLFDNLKKQVVESYPIGEAMTEQLVTAGGDNNWEIAFYPNGKDGEYENKIVLVVTYKQKNDEDSDAECFYRIFNNVENINHDGKIDRRIFKSSSSAYDAKLDRSIFDEFKQSCLIGVYISQYPTSVAKNNDQVQPEVENAVKEHEEPDDSIYNRASRETEILSHDVSDE
jgi:hypothetical protein